MSKYIPADKLIAEIEKMKKKFSEDSIFSRDEEGAKGERLIESEIHARIKCVLCDTFIKLVTTLQQEQPIEGKQVIIITETDGDANIHWDCRSLGDVKALLASAQSFIADKQVEELRGQGSGPDYNTTEGRFRNAHKFQQEPEPEVELEKEVQSFWNANALEYRLGHIADINFLTYTARHFYELGLNARKEE